MTSDDFKVFRKVMFETCAMVDSDRLRLAAIGILHAALNIERDASRDGHPFPEEEELN